MNKEEFYHTYDIEKAKSLYLNKGWLPLYRWIYKEETDKMSNWHHIFGYLIDPDKKESCMSLPDKDIAIDEYSATYGDNSYSKYSKEGIEPLVIVKTHQLKDSSEKRISVSEELIFYYNLFEEYEDELNRTYSLINMGEKEPVIKITPNEVLIKQKYLRKYIAIKKKHFILTFQFELEIESCYENEVNFDIEYSPNSKIRENTTGDTYILNSLVKQELNLIMSWQNMKVILEHDDINSIQNHFDKEDKDITFIVSYDNNTGDETTISIKEERCKHELTPVFFRKGVLEKYYNDATCEVTSTYIKNKFFFLKCDIDNVNYVLVLFPHLQHLPYNELLHWRGYNIAPEEEHKFSSLYYSAMIEGQWSGEIEMPDMLFKEKYKELTSKWKRKFDWDLFKPLNDNQEYTFKSLHIPTSQGLDYLARQISSLALILIDCINVKEISKHIDNEPKEQSIAKLKKYLILHNYPHEEIINFLVNLQSLRSGLTPAHRMSNKNKSLNKAMKYFGIKNDFSNTIESSKRIFKDSIYTLESLIDYYI